MANVQRTRKPGSVSNESASVSRSKDIDPVGDMVEYMKDYAREKPEMAALWCFGIGFVLGWKLKPW